MYLVRPYWYVPWYMYQGMYIVNACILISFEVCTPHLVCNNAAAGSPPLLRFLFKNTQQLLIVSIVGGWLVVVLFFRGFVVSPLFLSFVFLSFIFMYLPLSSRTFLVIYGPFLLFIYLLLVVFYVFVFYSLFPCEF